MSASRATIVQMYATALRALETKVQIVLAFLTLAMAPVFAPLAELETGPAIRLGKAGRFVAARAR